MERKHIQRNNILKVWNNILIKSFIYLKGITVIVITVCITILKP